MSINAPYIEQMRAKIIDTARRMLAGQLPYIEGVRAICEMLSDARLSNLEEPFVGFTAVDSETDAVPIGDVRERWHPEAKIKLAAEWERAELYAKSICEPACRAAIEWLEAHPTFVR
ncbi:hypothetical protein [Sphingomonas sp. UYP23]